MSDLIKKCSFRVTEEEKNIITKNKKILGLSESDYLRKKVFEVNDPVKILLDMRDKYILAKYNSKKDVTSQHFMQLKITNLNEVINNLVNFLEGKDLEF